MQYTSDGILQFEKGDCYKLHDEKGSSSLELNYANQLLRQEQEKWTVVFYDEARILNTWTTGITPHTKFKSRVMPPTDVASVFSPKVEMPIHEIEVLLRELTDALRKSGHLVDVIHDLKNIGERAEKLLKGA